MVRLVLTCLYCVIFFYLFSTFAGLIWALSINLAILSLVSIVGVLLFVIIRNKD